MTASVSGVFVAPFRFLIRKGKYWRFRLKKPEHSHGVGFGFLFRFISSSIAVIFATIVLLPIGFLTDWQLTPGILLFFSFLICIMVFIGEHYRSRVFERVIAGPEADVEVEVRTDRLPFIVKENYNEKRKGDYASSSIYRTVIPGGEKELLFDNLYSQIFKRVMDIVISSMALFFLTPLFCVVSALVWFESWGPVLFRREYYGFNNEPIVLYKFRTFFIDRPLEEGTPQQRLNNPRVTRVGRYLRGTRLDKLPQFLNVLAGDMSMVGPSPDTVYHNEHQAALIRGYYERHKVKPGITGWAQVNGLSGERQSPDKIAARIQHDIYYIENWSIWFDIKIIVMMTFHVWMRDE